MIDLLVECRGGRRPGVWTASLNQRTGRWLGFLALLSGWAAANRAQAEVKLGDYLTVYGNADVFIRDVVVPHAKDTSSLQLSQYQLDIDYLHPSGGLYSEVQLEGRGGDVFMNDVMDKNQFRIEAAYLGYHFDNGFDLRVGRFLSPSGYEGAEPWRRFTRIPAFGGIFAYLQNGIGLRYASPPARVAGMDMVFKAYAAYIDGAWSGDADPHDPSFEGLLGLDWGPITVRAGLAYERYDNDSPMLVPHQDRTLLNLWAQYVVGALTIAAEYNRQDQINGAVGGLWHGDVAFLFAKYAFTRHWWLGVRGSVARYDDRQGDKLYDSQEFTVTPRWQIYDYDNDKLDWDVRADMRLQHHRDAIQQFPGGVVLELGTTLRY